MSVPHPPPDAAQRREAPAVIAYDPAALPDAGLLALDAARATARKVAECRVPPRRARCIDLPRGTFLRISCPQGSQVGDLNLWSAADLSERFFSGKTRALHGSHLTTGDRLWSSLPHLRPLATITADTLGWYGIDADGAGVHDVIGTRCDPYTHHLLSAGADYHHCCHSNLTRALMAHRGLSRAKAELLVHDVLNVFMCTGFTRDSGRYFMKASPARAGDHIELFAETDLIAGLSACPGGDCGAEHSSDSARCHPLLMEVFAPATPPPDRLEPARNGHLWQETGHR